MPVGYLITVGLVAAGMVLALRPLGRSGRLGKVSWLASAVPNESPFVAFYWVLAVTLLALGQGDLDQPLAWAGLALVGASFVGTPVLVRRSLRARPAVERALEEGLGIQAPSAPLPWFRILVAPLPLFRRDVRRLANIAYGDAGRHNKLDLYQHRSRPSGGPILIHLHGGHFRGGRKSFEARPLLHGLASPGWICISANYRLRPAATFPDCLNGYYGPVDAGRQPLPSSPADYAHPGAPPVLIAHGEQDTFVPPEHARRFVERLRDSATNPVVYVELPGAQRSFDLFHSIRFETLIDGIESFAAWTRAQPLPGCRARRPPRDGYQLKLACVRSSPSRASDSTASAPRATRASGSSSGSKGERT